ncbi:MAG: amidohydrolase [Clostridiales bacterium]|jgi:amidohydrolase|nr:amidohydrolase [Clostridiales bacterium]
MDILKLVDTQKIIGWRRHLHMHPEVSFKEFETTEYIAQQIAKYPGVEVFRPAKTGLVAVLKGGKPGKTIGLRADIDALPITEEVDLPFASKNPGVMHACGHDCHTAMLLGALDVLHRQKDELKGTVKFIFQHAEEHPPGGALEIVNSGLLDDVEAFYGSHVFVDAPPGEVRAAVGPVTANADVFAINIQGVGTHAALPEKGIDTLLVGTEIVRALHTIIARNVSAFDNAVLTIGTFKAGNAHNIIPDTAEILGTVRTTTQEVREAIVKRINDIVNGICAAYGATAEIDYTYGYDAVNNHGGLCDYFAHIVTAALPHVTIEKLEPMMGGEDFSAYSKIAPALFATIGVGPKEGEFFQAHHPKFCVDEDGLPIGTAIYAAFALHAEQIGSFEKAN